MISPYQESSRAIESPTILQRIAAGEMSAVEECLSVYGTLAWQIARKYTNTSADAEDASQEIFIAIWKNAGRFDPAKSPEGAFICLVAKRRLIDRLRMQRRPLAMAASRSMLEPVSENFHQKLHLKLDAGPIVQALKGLSPSENELIRMSIYDGSSHGEIAEKIGLPLGTVKTRIRRGLNKIRRSLGILTDIKTV